MTIKMPARLFANLTNNIDNVMFMIEEIRDKWQDQYDDRSCNEPQYDSQIEKWQDALDRLEENISDLTDVYESYEEWKSCLDNDESDDSNYTVIPNLDDDFFDQYEEFVETMKEINSRKKGLTKTINAAQDIVFDLERYKDNYVIEDEDDEE